MQVGAVLVLANFLVCKREHLVDVIEALGVNVSGSVSESALGERKALTMPSLRATQAGQLCPGWAAVAS
jgi:hypothetical protein